MKGASVLVLPIICLVVTSTIVAMILIPVLFTKYHIKRNVNFEYNYDNAQLVLLSLLSSTENGETVYDIISEDIALNDYDDLGFLEEKLNRLVPSGCFELSTSSRILVSTCTPTAYESTTKIVIPSKQMTETLKLVID